MHHKHTFFIFFLIAATATFSIGIVFPIFSSITFQQGVEFLSGSASAEKRGLWLGILLAAAPITAFLSAPFAGFFSDLWGRKEMLLIVLSVICLSHGLAIAGIWFDHPFLLLTGRLIGGVGATGAAIANAVIGDISPPEKKARNFAWITTAAGLGAALGPVIGGKLSANGKYIEPFLLALCLVLINMALLALFFKDPVPVEMKTEFNPTSMFRSIDLLFKWAHLLIFFIIFLSVLIGWSAYWQFIPVNWLERYGLHPNQVGDFYSYAAIWFVLSSSILIQPFLGRFHVGWIFGICSLAIATTLLLLLFTQNPKLNWYVIPFQEFFYALFISTALAFASNSVKKELQGEVMGIMQSLQALGFLIAIVITSPWLGLTNQISLIVGSICFGIAALLVLTKKASLNRSME